MRPLRKDTLRSKVATELFQAIVSGTLALAYERMDTARLSQVRSLLEEIRGEGEISSECPRGMRSSTSSSGGSQAMGSWRGSYGSFASHCGSSISYDCSLRPHTALRQPLMSIGPCSPCWRRVILNGPGTPKS